MRFQEIQSLEDLISLVDEIGFLPFFENRIPGFSLEEIISWDCWYQGRWEGKIHWPAWEWKADVLQQKALAYGKLFDKKAGFVSKEWLPHLCNYRRAGYDFDARYDDGLAARKDKQVIDYLQDNGTCLSKQLKAALDYRKGGNKGFETVITRLQMQTYVTPVNFEYSKRKNGEEYGWGVARYGIMEDWWGEDLCTSEYRTDPQESFEKIVQHVAVILPDVDEAEIRKLLK